MVDASLYESVLAVMESIVPDWEIGGYQRERTGSITPNVAPSNTYPTADGAILIGANRDTIFRRLTKAMSQPELATNPRYATHVARGENQQELDERISAWTMNHESGPLLDLLTGHGIPAGWIYRVKDMLEDPHFQARESIIRLNHPVFGDFPMQNVFPRLSDTPGTVRSLGPKLGEHNDDVYRGLLGLGEDEIASLAGNAVI